MTVKQANALFQTKYPEGEFFGSKFGSHFALNDNGRMYGKCALCFNKTNGKVYVYSGTYESVLEHLGFTVPSLEKKRAERKAAEKALNEKMENDPFWFDPWDWDDIAN